MSGINIGGTFNSAPSNPILEISQTGFFLGKPAFVFNFPGRRSVSNASTTAMQDVVEFALTDNKVPILEGTNKIDVISTSAADSVTGTGVRTIELVYVDQEYNLQSTTVTLNGTTPVLVKKGGVDIQPQGIWWAHAVNIGTGRVAAGDITFRIASSGTLLTPGTPVETILAGGNMSISARCVVPAGYTGYLYDFFASPINANQDVRLRATVSKLTRELINPYCFQAVISIKEGSPSMKILPYLKVPEKTRIKVSSIPSAINSRVETSFTVIFVKN